MLIDNVKYACEPCMRGHRSSKCNHQDRILIKVRKPGRPLSSCPHEGNGNCSCASTRFAIPKGVSCQCGPQPLGPNGEMPQHIHVHPVSSEGHIVNGMSYGANTSGAIAQSPILNGMLSNGSIPLATLPDGSMALDHMNSAGPVRGTSYGRNRFHSMQAHPYPQTPDIMGQERQSNIEGATLFKLKPTPGCHQERHVLVRSDGTRPSADDISNASPQNSTMYIHGMGPPPVTNASSSNYEFHDTNRPYDANSFAQFNRSYASPSLLATPYPSVSTTGQRKESLGQSSTSVSLYDGQSTNPSSLSSPNYGRTHSQDLSASYSSLPGYGDQYHAPNLYQQQMPSQYPSNGTQVNGNHLKSPPQTESSSNNLSTQNTLPSPTNITGSNEGNRGVNYSMLQSFYNRYVISNMSVEEHDCSCGPNCQCVLCAKHPFNEATSAYVENIHNIEDSMVQFGLNQDLNGGDTSTQGHDYGENEQNSLPNLSAALHIDNTECDEADNADEPLQTPSQNYYQVTKVVGHDTVEQDYGHADENRLPNASLNFPMATGHAAYPLDGAALAATAYQAERLSRVDSYDSWRQ